MPIYAYECGACGATHDFLQKMGEGRKRKCPSCGERRLRKLVTAAAFHLKGTGWYATDFRDKGKDSDKGKDDKKPKEESKAEAGAKGESSSSGDAKGSGSGKASASSDSGGSGASAPAD